MTNYSYDMLLRNARPVFPLGKIRESMDIGIRNGIIAELGPGLDPSAAAQVMDIKGALVSPGFVETHAYIEYAFASGEMVERANRSVVEALNGSAALLNICPDPEREFLDRMNRALEKYAANGTTHLRVALLPCSAMIGLRAFHKAKEMWVGRMDLYVTVPYEERYSKEWEEFAVAGLIDAAGCWPDIRWDDGGVAHPLLDIEKLRKTIDLAAKYRLPIDIDCTPVPGSRNIASFDFAAGRALPANAFTGKPADPDHPLFYGRINCCHADTLGDQGLDSDLGDQAIYKCAKTYVNYTAMTTDAMALAQENRRSLSPVRSFLNAGVNVSVSCGHFRDLFHPFGNGDLLEELLTTAQAHQVGTRGDMEKFFEFITYNPAKTLQLEGYGLLPGCKADLVVLNASTIQDAIISQPIRRYVFKAGKLVAENADGGR